jgi:hypothetical protein
MELNSEPYRTCSCGRTFSEPGPFIYHQRSCSKSKKQLAGALTLAKQAWADRKRRRVADEGSPEPNDAPLNMHSDSANHVGEGVRVRYHFT